METDPNRTLRIGVVGLGFLGRGIAACVLGRGLEVVGWAPETAELDEAGAFISRAIDELIEHTDYDAALRNRWRRSFHATSSLADLADCDFVIESVVEDLEIKRKVLGEIEAVIRTTTPIGTNTSAIPISTLQDGLRQPGRLLGMHWSEPAHATRFLELIRGSRTSDETFEGAARLARRLGREPCLVEQDLPGFIVNRLAYAMYREALHLLESGVADVETIDRAFRNACGLWASVCGPFRWMDITGGPALYSRAMRGVLPTLADDSEPAETIRRLEERGARGSRDGVGFYSYADGEHEKWQRIYGEQVWRVKRVQDACFPLEE